MERLTGKQAQNMMEAVASVYDVINEMDERSPEANAAKQEAAKLAAQKRRESQNVKQDAADSGAGGKAQQTAASAPAKKSDRPAENHSKKRTPVTAGGGAPEEDGQVDRYRRAAQERARKNRGMDESTDLFDIVKGHLIDEHNLSEDVAIQVMILLDEETRGEIMEYTASMGAGPRGTTVKMTADGKEPVGDRLLKGIGKKIGGFLNRLNPNALKSKTVEPRKPLVQQNNSFEPEGELVDEGSCGSKKKKKSKKGGY